MSRAFDQNAQSRARSNEKKTRVFRIQSKIQSEPVCTSAKKKREGDKAIALGPTKIAETGVNSCSVVHSADASSALVDTRGVARTSPRIFVRLCVPGVPWRRGVRRSDKADGNSSSVPEKENTS